jgi:hypothetical protein
MHGKPRLGLFVGAHALMDVMAIVEKGIERLIGHETNISLQQRKYEKQRSTKYAVEVS